MARSDLQQGPGGSVIPVERERFSGEILGLVKLTEPDIAPAQIRVSFRVRRPDLESSLELCHRFDSSSGTSVLDAQVLMRFGEGRRDVDGLLQLPDGLRGVVRLRVAPRFLEQAYGFL